MNREDIIAMAREAGFNPQSLYMESRLERFATLVAAAERNSWPAEMEAMERQVNILTDALAQAKAEEREACAKVCEAEAVFAGSDGRKDASASNCAAAIRARSSNAA